MNHIEEIDLGIAFEQLGTRGAADARNLVRARETWIDPEQPFPTSDAIEQAWLQFLVERARATARQRIEGEFEQVLAEGFIGSQFPFKLRCTLADIDMYEKGRQLCALGGLLEIEIADYDGVLHVVKFDELSAAVAELGLHYGTLWTRRQRALMMIEEADAAVEFAAVQL